MIKSLLDSGWDGIISLQNDKHTVPYSWYNKENTKNKELYCMDVDPEIVELGVRLAEVTAKNTASVISNKLRAFKQGRDDKKTIAEMNELIYELLDEKQELESIAKVYQEEVIGRKLSEEDLNFISETVIPVIVEFMEKIAASQDKNESLNTLKAVESLKAFEPLLSINTLNVLQMIGFNFKKGIGEPLTELLKNTINGTNKVNQAKLNEVLAEREVEYFKLIQDSEAFERFRLLRNN